MNRSSCLSLAFLCLSLLANSARAQSVEYLLDRSTLPACGERRKTTLRPQEAAVWYFYENR